MVTVDGSNAFPLGFRRWDEGRPAPDHVQKENSFTGQEARSSPPLTVARALREHCNIPFESFFLATHLGNGKFAYFSGPSLICEEDIRKMFRRDKFIQFQNREASSEDPSNTYDDDYDVDGGCAARTNLSVNGQYQPEPRRRKRPRRQGGLRRCLDEDAPPVVTTSKRTLEVGDEEALMEFYDHRFKSVQQTACKEIAKAFVKLVAPKKQANNPYTGGDSTLPDWWPGNWGPGEKDKTRHVEPDHLWKRERVHVLKHVLRLVINPATQPPSFQRLEGLNVAKLEAAAMESLSAFFEDRNKPRNAKKRPILKELFRVAKMEEKFKRNEIDAKTQIFVTEDDMVMECCFDTKEDEEDEEEETRLMEEAERARTNSVSSRVSPITTSAMGPGMLPSLPPQGAAVQTLTSQFQTASFLNVLSSDLAPEHYPYADGPNLSAMGGPAPMQSTTALQMHDLLTTSHPHDTSRRSSLFTPTTDFSSSPYHPAPWSQSPPPAPNGTPTSSAASSPETASPLFGYAPPHHQHQHQHPHHNPHHPHHPHHQQQQQHQQTILPPPPALPLPMPAPMSQHHHQQQQAPAGPYAAQQYPHPHAYDAMSHHHHHHPHNQHHQQQQQQHSQSPNQTLFRGGSIHLSIQGHHPHH